MLFIEKIYIYTPIHHIHTRIEKLHFMWLTIKKQIVDIAKTIQIFHYRLRLVEEPLLKCAFSVVALKEIKGLSHGNFHVFG